MSYKIFGVNWTDLVDASSESVAGAGAKIGMCGPAKVPNGVRLFPAEGRLFLLRLLELDRLGNRLAGRRALGAACDANDKTVSSVLSLLCDLGFLVSSCTFSEKGQKVAAYELTGKLRAALATGSDISCDSYYQLIKALCFPQEGYGFHESKKRGGVSRSHRYLLSVLLYHAGHCGVVRNITMNQLSEKSGLTLDRLRSHLKFFLREKYLRSCVRRPERTEIFQPGAVIFFLNLNHPVFGLKKTGFNIRITSQLITPDNQALAANMMFIRARDTLSKVPADSESEAFLFNALEHFPHKLDARFFKGVKRTKVTVRRRWAAVDDKSNAGKPALHNLEMNQHLPERFLQAKLDQYASDLLSKHWDDLKNNQKTDYGFISMDTKELQEQVLHDLFPGDTSIFSDVSSEQRTLAECCVWASVQMALSLQPVIGAISNIDPSHYHYSIFPPVIRGFEPRLKIGVGIFPRDSHASSRMLRNDDFSIPEDFYLNTGMRIDAVSDDDF